MDRLKAGADRRGEAGPDADARIEREAAELERRARAGRLALLQAEIGRRYAPAATTLESYRVYSDKQKPVVETLRGHAADADALAGRGLVFFGSVGTGKDHLAAALLYRAVEAFGLTARWVNGRNLFGASRDAIAESRAESEVIGPLVEPKILCLSDVVPIEGALTAWNVDLLYRVVDARYRELRPTWLTLNVRDEADAKARLTPPVWDRLREDATFLACFWPSFRERKPQ